MTNQESNGQTVLPAKEHLADVNNKIDRYILNKGIKKLTCKDDVEVYLNMPRAEMSKLSAEECCEAGIVLSRYAAFLQESFNTELGKVTWITQEIYRKITPVLQQYKGSSADERKNAAIQDNEYTAKLDELRSWAQGVADRLAFMANRVEAIAKAYISLSQTKRK